MIACISPGMSSADHSINTLRYADRLKGGEVKVNIFMSQAEQDQIMQDEDNLLDDDVNEFDMAEINEMEYNSNSNRAPKQKPVNNFYEDQENIEDDREFQNTNEVSMEEEAQEVQPPIRQ